MSKFPEQCQWEPEPVLEAKVEPEREHPPESLPGARQDPRPNTPVPESQSGPRRRCWPETVMNGLALALDVTEKAGAAFPPLQAVAGSLTVITKVVKKTCSNEDDLCALQSYVEQLNRIISPDTLPPSQDWPVAFNARVSNLASGLQKVQDRVVDLQSERSLERVLNVQERAGLMADCVRTLGQLVATFTMQGSITTELGINRVAFKVEETRQDITGQLKELLHASQNFLHQPGAIPGLHPTFSAMYNDSEGGRSECEPETRKEALATIFAWILGLGHSDLSAFPPPVLDVDHRRPIMWLYALAGAGKSTLAQTTAEWCALRRILAASFFCARDGDRSNVLAIMPTIAYQLGLLCDIFREALRKAVADNPNVHQMSVASQLQTLIVSPLEKALKGGSHAFDGLVVIIDALDECMDDEAVSVVVKSLSLHHERVVPLRFFVTSRPEPNIKAGFILPTLAANTQEFPLSAIPDNLTEDDISLFLQKRLQEIASRNYLGPGWPSGDVLKRLVSLTELLFIFAATAVRFIGDVEVMDPEGRLSELLRAGSEAAAIGNSKTSPFRILDALYVQVLASVRRLLGEAALAQLRHILGAVVLAKERLGPAALEALLNLSRGAARRFLSRLTAILIIPDVGDDSLPIRLIHLSFANFIVDSTRCTEPAFLINPALHHALLAKGCFCILHTLRHNICDVDRKHGHLLNSEIPNLQETVARHLTPERQYAVKYWAHHFRHAAVDIELLDSLDAFCDNHLLDWLEALSLMGCVDVAVAALQSAQQTLKDSKLPLSPTNAPALLYDCERIVRAFYEGISASFFEVLRATATFAPLSSPLRQRHAAHLPGMVLLRRGWETAWSTTLTSTASDSTVECLDFSPDGNIIACGTRRGTIQLRNVQTGAEMHVMAGESCISSVCFAPDGKAIMSGERHGSVALWDVATGACLGKWQSHPEWIRSIAWSSDGTFAASGFSDGKIVLWSIGYPEESTTLPGHNHGVNSVVFASDGTLVSGSDDWTCKIWNTRTDSLLWTLEHDSGVRCAAVSPDSQIVACGLQAGEITLWSNVDGAKLHLLPGPAEVISLAFGANGTLAAAYKDSSLILWDVCTKKALTRLLAMFATPYAITVSPDGVHIGVSTDIAVHIIRWPTDGSGTLGPSGKNTELSELDIHAPASTAAGIHNHMDLRKLSISPDGRLVVAVLRNEVLLLEVSTGDVVHTLEFSGEFVISDIVWSSGASFVAWGDTKDVWVSETKPGGRIRRLAGHSGWVNTVHFTRDEQDVLSASHDGTIRRWDLHEEHPSPAILFQCDGDIHELAVSSDGKWMLSGARDRTPPDLSSPDLIAKPSRKPFVNNGYYPTLRLHEASGRVLWFEHVTHWITSLAFSHDCTCAVAGLYNGLILLYDLTQLLRHITTSSNASTPLPHPKSSLTVPEYEFRAESKRQVKQIAFSPDGQGLIHLNGHIVVPAELRPLSSQNKELFLPPAYFYKVGWLWSYDPDIGGQRLCWIPPAFRYMESYPERFWLCSHATTLPPLTVRYAAYAAVLPVSACTHQLQGSRYVHTHRSDFDGTGPTDSAGIHTPLQETERQYSPTPRPAHDAPQETAQQKETSAATTLQAQDLPLPASTDETIGVVDDSFSAATPLDQQYLSVVGSERDRSPGTRKCPPELASEKKRPLHMGPLGPDVEEVPRQPVVPERHLGRTLMNGLKITLNVMKETSAAFPPLQSVAGGLLAIVDVVEQVSTNEADIRTVEAYVVQLNNMVSPTSLPPMAQWPSEFKKRLDDFVKELKKIEQDMQCLASETRAGRVVNARERAGKVSEHVQSLGRVVQTFTARGTISTELGIGRVEGKIDGGVQHLDEQFLGVHTHIDEALERHRNQPQGPGDAIPGLHPTFSAMYNDSEGGRSECEPETRREALATIFAWILGPGHPDLSAFPPPVLDVDHHRPIMWLYALAGAGKSTLAQTTAQWCDSRRILAASFFCARDGDRSNVLAIMPTIAQQLARLCVVFREALREAVANNPNVHQMSVASQLQTLIIEPLRKAVKGGSHAFDGLVVIIDALDECMDDEAVSVVVKSLSLHHERVAPLKFLVTSRPEPNIKAGFVLPALAANTQEFPLSKIPDEHTARDIKHFLRSRLQEVRRRYDLEAEWPSEDQLSRLVALTELLFIFAATAVLYVGDKRARNPKAQLDRLLEAGRAAAALGSSKTSPFKVLDAIYIQAIMLGLNDLEEEAGSQLQLMLATITLAQERLHPATLEALLDLPAGTAMRLLPSLHAILALPSSSGDNSSPIRLIHLSFADFIVDPSRCTEPTFLIYPSHHHTSLAKSCLRILLTLRHNICEVEPKYGHLRNSEIPNLQETVARYLTAERQYAIKYWAHHFRHAAVNKELLDSLDAFCDNHLLNWLEALSLMGCVDVAVAALQSAQQTLKDLKLPVPPPPTDTPALLYDCERIVRAFYEGISTSFFEDGGIELRNVQTGVEMHVMVGVSRTTSVCFSPDGKGILSGDAYGFVTLWDVATVTWSSDGAFAASASDNWKIVLWSVASPEESSRLPGYQRQGNSVVFASDGALISGSDDKTCKIWDTHTKFLLRTLEHNSEVRSVAVSPDSQIIACGQWDGEITLWSKADGAKLHLLPGSAVVISLAFGANGTLAAAYEDSSLILWDVCTKQALTRLLSMFATVRLAVAFSPDGVHIGVSTSVAVHIVRWPTDGSGTFHSSGKTIEFSELDSHPPASTASGGHDRQAFLGLSISPDGRLVVALLRNEVLLLEVSTDDVVHTLEYRSWAVRSPIVWSSGARFIGWGDDKDVCVWEMKPGGRIRRLAGHSDWVRAVHFTRDEEHVLSASDDGTIHRWDLHEEHPSPAILFQCDGNIDELAVSSDGKWMLSGSRDRTPPDLSSPDLIAKPSRKPFVKNGYYPTLRLHDASGRVLWIEHVTGWMTSLAFSDDCTRAVAGLKDGRILLYDLTQLLPHRTTSSNASTPLSHPALIVTEYEFSTGSRRMGAQISFSPDGLGLVSSESYTVVPAELRPLSTRYTDLSLPPAYFFKHGWLWSSDPDIGSQRLCWMPPAFRYIESYPERFWSVHGHIIVCASVSTIVTKLKEYGIATSTRFLSTPSTSGVRSGNVGGRSAQ
ncbi:hypothetical protein ACG7TL_008220 [Trametes sanguinea]